MRHSSKTGIDIANSIMLDPKDFRFPIFYREYVFYRADYR